MEIFEAPLIDDDLLKLAFRLVHNLFYLTLVVRYALKPSAKERDFVFTAVMLNLMVFFICFTMKKLEIGLGMALGLFAIFGVLRYRTDTIRAKEMTYLFILIGIAVINSLSNKQTSYVELQASNLIIFAAAWHLERYLAQTQEEDLREVALSKLKQIKHTIEYDNLELVAPNRRPELLEDLIRRTGLQFSRVQVGNINLQTGTATLVAWYDEVHHADLPGNGNGAANDDSDL